MKARSLFFLLFLLRFTPSGAQCVFINEIYSRPATAGTNGNPCDTGEWIELFNASSSPADISCYSFCSFENHSGTNRGHCVSIPPGTVLAPGGFYLIGGNGSICPTCDFTTGALNLNWHSFSCASAMVTGVNQSCGTCGVANRMQFLGVFHDTGEDLSLFDAAGNFVDGVTYGARGNRGAATPVAIAAAGGCPAKNIIVPASGDPAYEFLGPAGAAGSGFERTSNGGPAWAAITTATATPGTSNGATVSCVLLPFIQAELAATQVLDFTTVSWNINTDLEVQAAILEISQDGTDFSPLSECTGNCLSGQFNVRTIAPKSYFRIQVLPLSGGSWYSQVIEFLQPDAADWLSITGQGRQLEALFTIPGNFCLQSMEGKILNSVFCTANQSLALIPEGISPGIYLLSFYSDSSHLPVHFRIQIHD